MSGYIGAEPTNDNTANNGVFSIKDLNELRRDGNLKSATFSCDFVVVGAGGASGSGTPAGGGGGGGVVSSVDNNGGGSSLESALTLSPGVDYHVSIGAGASGNTTVGGGTVFHTIRALGGGSGWDSNQAHEGASGGGGGHAFNYTNYGRSVIGSLNNRENFTGAGAIQGYRGSQTSYESYTSTGGGGGAGVNGSITNSGSNGVIVNIAAHGTADVGEVSGSNVYFGGGGGSSTSTSNYTTGGTGGGGTGHTHSNNHGTANTGGGAGAKWNGGSGNGGSGTVVLRYPDHLTCTAGAGVTASAENAESGSLKSIAITAGDGNVSFA